MNLCTNLPLLGHPSNYRRLQRSRRRRLVWQRVPVDFLCLPAAVWKDLYILLYKARPPRKHPDI